ncbi:MAG: hypothetical protein COB08_005515 [Rhodobacteraceae bacterium]|nr:hypothetical protein [Paracoccaceae bacterium]
MTQSTTHQERLLGSLFEHEGRQHLNLKFFRGSNNEIAPEDLCDAVATSIFKIDAGLIEAKTSFGDADRKQTEVAKIIAAA